MHIILQISISKKLFFLSLFHNYAKLCVVSLHKISRKDNKCVLIIKYEKHPGVMNSFGKHRIKQWEMTQDLDRHVSLNKCFTVLGPGGYLNVLGQYEAGEPMFSHTSLKFTSLTWQLQKTVTQAITLAITQLCSLCMCYFQNLDFTRIHGQERLVCVDGGQSKFAEQMSKAVHSGVDEPASFTNNAA